MNNREAELANKIGVYVNATYNKLDKDCMKQGNGIFNNRCHMNSVQCMRDDKNEATEVYACITLDAGTTKNPIVHFINKTEDGFFVDNTLGWSYVQYDYYLIKKLSDEECDHVWDTLQNIRTSLVDIHCSKLYQKFFKIKPHVVM